MHRLRFPTFAILVFLGSLHAFAQVPVGQSTTARVTPPRVTSPRMFPGTRADVLTTIQGNALTSTNGTLADGLVRLRDARLGRIVDMTTTDKAGLFAFRGVEPGSYIVELVSEDQSILAASQILFVDAGDAVSAVVKLPFRIPPFEGVLGHSVASAAVVATTAAASGVLATQVSGSDDSPRR
ncbi:MAG: hypothetical protein ACHQO8_11545 [Vicinamibacterales bacterium]